MQSQGKSTNRDTFVQATYIKDHVRNATLRIMRIVNKVHCFKSMVCIARSPTY